MIPIRQPGTNMEPNSQQQPNQTSEGFQLIPLGLIDDPAKPLRSDLTPDSVADLVLSIKQMGIIEPVIVKPRADRFEVIAGHRRLLAATIAKLALVPCIIKVLGVEETEIMKLHENIYREDISPVDEAKHFDYLIQRLKLSPAKIAQLISRSPTYISERLAIFNYPDELRMALQQKKIVFSVARVFARHPDPEKIRTFLRYAISNGMTPTMAEKWVKDDLKLLERRSEAPPEDLSGDTLSKPEVPYYNCYL